MSLSTPGVGEDVITVGSYINRGSYETLDIGMYPDPPLTSGARSPSSSIGPRSDGLIKPDISAPGHNVLSARTSTPDINFLGDWEKLKDSRYIPHSGTSMSTPAVSGGVALFLEMYPAAPRDEIRMAIRRSAHRDAHTGLAATMPNALWGMGKFDLFALLTDNISMVPDRSRSRVSSGIIWSRPMPASERVTIAYPGRIGSAGILAIYNRIGQEVERIQLLAETEEMTLDVAAWPAGIYHCRLTMDGTVAVGSMVIAR